MRIEIPRDPTKRTESDEELILATQDILDAYIEKLKEEGRAEGRAEGLNEARNERRCRAHRDPFITGEGEAPAVGD